MPSTSAQNQSWPMNLQSLWVERVKAGPQDAPPCPAPIGQVRHVDEPFVMDTNLSWEALLAASSQDATSKLPLGAFENLCISAAQLYLAGLAKALAEPIQATSAVLVGKEKGLFDAMVAALGHEAPANKKDLSKHQLAPQCLRWTWLQTSSQGNGTQQQVTQDRYKSFWLERLNQTPNAKALVNGPGQAKAQAAQVAECCFVLLAGHSLGNEASLGDVGLRIVVHLRPLENGLVQLRIHGVTFSRWWLFAQEPKEGPPSYAEIPARLDEKLKVALGLDKSDLLKIFSYRPFAGGSSWLKVGVSYAPKASNFKQALQWQRAFIDVNNQGDVLHIAYARAAKAAAASQRVLWGADPLSRTGPKGLKPSVGSKKLPQVLSHKVAPARSGPGPFGDSRKPPFEVSAGHWSRQEPALPVKKRFTSDMRSDSQAVQIAQQRTKAFFGLFAAWGMSLDDYFRFAKLPLQVRVRGPITGASARDLEAAEVKPILALSPSNNASLEELSLPYLAVTYGAAAPHVRLAVERSQPLVDIKASTPGRSNKRKKNSFPREPGRAQYLSIAADARWVCHEMAHVAQFASTGELQLPFAHGVGDSLAAIAMDPDSRLANRPRWRGMTYPWVQIPGRRHDHAPVTGYAWCGARNQARSGFGRNRSQHFHGYFEEQLLSSSMFRLYRSMGGDTSTLPLGGKSTVADLQRWAQRREAANYCMFLMLRALSLLGPDGLAPAQTADQWVSALIEADLATRDWHSPLAFLSTPRNGMPNEGQWTGGLLHKVIRWAFERQGLYATANPDAVQEGMGLPPPIDLYFQDLRGDANDPGGYSPVPLYLPNAPGEKGPKVDCRWLSPPPTTASSSGEGTHWVVPLFSRGQTLPKADGIEVKAWVSSGLNGDSFAQWTELPSEQRAAFSAPTTNMEPGKEATQTFLQGAVAEIQIQWELAPQAGQYVLLAVRAPGDACLLNLDGSDGSASVHWAAPATDAKTLMHQVAFDNNLALIACA